MPELKKEESIADRCLQDEIAQLEQEIASVTFKSEQTIGKMKSYLEDEELDIDQDATPGIRDYTNMSDLTVPYSSHYH